MGRNENQPPDAEDTKTVKAAVQALAISLNTVKVYQAGHPVLQNIIKERFLEIKKVLKRVSPLKLTFRDGQVLCRNKLIAADYQFAEKLARTFEKNGVKGLEIEAEVSQQEFEFFALSVKEIEGGASKTLNELLREREVVSIREYDPEESMGDGYVNSGYAREGRSDVYDLDMDIPADLEELDWNELVGDTGGEDQATEFCRFVDGVLDDAIEDRSLAEEKSRVIADEFEKRLDAEIENYKQQTEEHIRRLESIKDLVLKELEERGIAALVIDSRFNVLAMNNRAKQLLGTVSRLGDESDLARFVRSGQDTDKIKVEGAEYTAHVIISEGEGNELQTVLLCLD